MKQSRNQVVSLNYKSFYFRLSPGWSHLANQQILGNFQRRSCFVRAAAETLIHTYVVTYRIVQSDEEVQGNVDPGCRSRSRSRLSQHIQESQPCYLVLQVSSQQSASASSSVPPSNQEIADACLGLTCHYYHQSKAF